VDTTFCSEYKISAALNLAMLVTEKYELISNEEISEVIQELPEKYTAFDIAKNLEADGILVVKVEQLRNLLRAEISRINPESPENVITGEGYAMLHYFTDDEHRAIYDPSLLLALQRAFAVVESDSVLFEKQNAKPAPLLAICGIEFQKGENSEKFIEYRNDKKMLNDILKEGASNAHFVASRTLSKVYKKIGLYSLDK
jgi:hypothetical protein